MQNYSYQFFWSCFLRTHWLKIIMELLVIKSRGLRITSWRKNGFGLYGWGSKHFWETVWVSEFAFEVERVKWRYDRKLIFIRVNVPRIFAHASLIWSKTKLSTLFRKIKNWIYIMYFKNTIEPKNQSDPSPNFHFLRYLSFSLISGIYNLHFKDNEWIFGSTEFMKIKIGTSRTTKKIKSIYPHRWIINWTTL